DEHTTPMERQEIALAGRATEPLRIPEQLAPAGRIVPAEINCFPDLGYRIRQRLARLPNQQTQIVNAPVFEKIRRAIETRHPLGRGNSVPGRLRSSRSVHGLVNLDSSGVA